MSLLQFLAILRARRAAAGLILLVTLLASLAFVLLRPASYQAQVPVLVDVRADAVGGGYGPALLASYIATQIDVARSDAVATRALQLLKGEPAPGEVAAKPAAGTPAVNPADRALTLADLEAGRVVRPARESNIVQIQWRGPDSEQAARVANALARAFVEVSLGLKTGPARADAGWMEQQVAQARQNLEAAQMQLADFQRRAGLVGTEQTDFETARLNALSTQLAQVQAENTDAQAKRGASRDTVAEVMDSALVNGLKADIARLEARRQEASANLGPRHPQMERMEAELEALRARLASETRQVATAIDTRWRAGRERERELSAAVEAQRQRVLALNHGRASLSLLQQDVDAARRNFEQVSTQASRSRLQSLATQADLVLMSPASAPATAQGPGAREALAVGGVAGLVLAIAGALMLELAHRRVRSVDDIALVAGVPVLATVPPAGGPPGLRGPTRRLGFAGGAAA